MSQLTEYTHSMHSNERLIQMFYESFQRKNADGMIACYHADVTFSDPVFGTLDAQSVESMWRMLFARAKSLEVTFRDVHADDEAGGAHWEANYPFGPKERHIHNFVDASFRFRDGKIVRHQDRFDLWRWSGMALGVPGRLFGWLLPMQNAIRKNAIDGLTQFRRATRASA